MIPTQPPVPRLAAEARLHDRCFSYPTPGGSCVRPDNTPPHQPPSRQPGVHRCGMETTANASPVASLLVAALLVLRQPCVRNQATARLLLERASADDSLTPVEREACRSLADDLDLDYAVPDR